jgi:hypothetical protein
MGPVRNMIHLIGIFSMVTLAVSTVVQSRLPRKNLIRTV